jgi:hypothetical protein
VTRTAAWLVIVWGVILGGEPLAAQAFHPPPVAGHSRGTRIGLLGFGLRAGVDVSGDGQAVFGGTIDAGSLFIDQLRLRPSAEIGIQNGANTYAGNIEILYRLARDEHSAVPYVGGGMAFAGHAQCGSDSSCPSVWVNVVMGVEVRYRSTFNWLIEYHGMDAFRHNRLYIGLTTRRGS